MTGLFWSAVGFSLLDTLRKECVELSRAGDISPGKEENDGTRSFPAGLVGAVGLPFKLFTGSSEGGRAIGEDIPLAATAGDDVPPLRTTTPPIELLLFLPDLLILLKILLAPFTAVDPSGKGMDA